MAQSMQNPYAQRYMPICQLDNTSKETTGPGEKNYGGLRYGILALDKNPPDG